MHRFVCPHRFSRLGRSRGGVVVLFNVPPLAGIFGARERDAHFRPSCIDSARQRTFTITLFGDLVAFIAPGTRIGALFAMSLATGGILTQDILAQTSERTVDAGVAFVALLGL